ncbi:VIT1/CCC1 transporter family protein [Corynebacterium sp. CCM 9185]|uniref:VIT1/CCC1 transporter family protein n=1 Tax=Corynebacterium marambiense TaxID=2765364 RepID=A0ABS0VZZ6_9CORY|nr:VIT1/CCC1 transporter family protein [Corynebacterium marambiense]MBI9000978.1 VIT1/CCC1 transporter family protein [Corynebacterium marambiense]MCK7662751.1 VIT1/CCC1 transporter family protein [Corynebacterium marambiense]
MTENSEAPVVGEPTRAQIKRWQRYLANERAEAAVYRELALHKTGEERDILLSLADAEARHEEHWRTLLGNHVGMPRRPDYSTLLMGFLARRFGSVFTLALMQSAEQRTPYLDDEDATDQMTADECIHAEVVRGLAARGREQISGNFRAAVFGMNDGLVSNLALILGVVGAVTSNGVIVMTGLTGLLAGALSMAAGEYISVSSQRDLLEASTADPMASAQLPQLDVNSNELELVYRARGMSGEEAKAKAAVVFAGIRANRPVEREAISTVPVGAAPADPEVVGSGMSAAVSSFLFFASGALIPCVPFFFGLSTLTATVISCILVGIALLCTGSIVGLLSGVQPLRKALVQLAVGIGAAAATFGLGNVLGVLV